MPRAAGPHLGRELSSEAMGEKGCAPESLQQQNSLVPQARCGPMFGQGPAQQTEDPRAVVYISFPFSFFGGLLSKQTRSDKLGETQPNKS